MRSNELLYIYCGLILVSFCLCLYKYSLLGTGLKIILGLLGLSIVTEFLAFFTGSKSHNTMPIFGISDLFQYVLFVLFYRAVLPGLRRNYIYLIIIIIGLVFGVINMLFWQSIYESNTYFLAFEGLLVILLSLLVVYRYLLLTERSAQEIASLRISLILSFFWAATFFSWGLLDVTDKKNVELLNLIQSTIIVVNILTYLGIGIVFLLIPKPQPKT